MGRGQTLWCILRTASLSTMPLAKGLREAGIEAWTPIEIQSRRRPRSKDRFEREMAIMPSYVFASYAHIDELLKLARTPMQTYLRWDSGLRRMVAQGIPQFTVFLHNNRIPLIADEHLEALRVVERRTAPKPVAPAFAPGETVKLIEGGFAGMAGVVDRVQGDYALVTFPNYPIAIKIARLLLHPSMLPDDEPEADVKRVA